MSVLHVLADQHRAIAHLFIALSCEASRECREHLSSRLAEELIAHMAVEKAVFRPAVEQLLGEQRPDVHAAVRLELRRLLATDPADPSFPERVASARARFEEHVREEEELLFPRLERTVSREQLDALAARVAKSRPPVWMVTPERRVLDADDAISAGPSVEMPGVASNDAAR
ncbi:MAG TPA: hemerythrin domain-containing protein [Polyangiaceae bacterium]